MPGKKGYKYITTKITDIMPAIKLVEDEETRKKIMFAFKSISTDNGPLID